MNNQNILWKTSIFKWIQILLCIVPLLVPTTADVAYNETNFRLFDPKIDDFEKKIFASLQTTKNFFATGAASTATLYGLLVGSFVPFLSQAAGVVFVIRALLAVDSDWKENFSKTIAHETGRQIALGHLQVMEASIETFRKKFRLMGESNTDMENRKTIASIIHTKIDEMLNVFAHRDSLFKKYPLIGAPLLIVFSLLIAYFDPMAKTLIPLEAMNPEHSCTVRNLLIDYRRLTINARLEKLHLESSYLPDSQFYAISSTLQKSLDHAMSTNCQKYRCNRIKPPTPPSIKCKKGCVRSSAWSKRYYLRYGEYEDRGLCLKDAFGADEYSEKNTCIIDYALLVRHRVEQLFPITLFNKFCVDPPKTTGFGFLTIKLRELRAHRRWDDARCDDDLGHYCDPFVRVFINDTLQMTTETKTDTCCYNVDATFISKKIYRNSWVKIEVIDADMHDDEELILRTEGSIESFLKKGQRGVPLNLEKENYINTVSFWQDEYDYDRLKLDIDELRKMKKLKKFT